MASSSSKSSQGITTSLVSTTMEKSHATSYRQPRLFPELLHCLLEDCENDNASNIVSWGADGRSFKVHRKDEFTEKILPRYFRQSRYKSFARQLNIWGFSCVTSGVDKGHYCHAHFVKYNRGLCNLMKRQPKVRLGQKAVAASNRGLCTHVPSFLILPDTRLMTTGNMDRGVSPPNDSVFQLSDDMFQVTSTIESRNCSPRRSQRELLGLESYNEDVRQRPMVSFVSIRGDEVLPSASLSLTATRKHDDHDEDWFTFLEMKFDDPDSRPCKWDVGDSFCDSTTNHGEESYGPWLNLLEPRPLRMETYNDEMKFENLWKCGTLGGGAFISVHFA